MQMFLASRYASVSNRFHQYLSGFPSNHLDVHGKVVGSLCILPYPLVSSVAAVKSIDILEVGEMDKPTLVTPSPAEVLYEQQHITDNRAPTVIAADVVCFSLACIAVCMRLASRRIAKIKYMADDWLIIGALVCSSHHQGL